MFSAFVSTVDVYIKEYYTSIPVPGLDYTRLEPCTYWAEEDTNNSNNDVLGKSLEKVIAARLACELESFDEQLQFAYLVHRFVHV